MVSITHHYGVRKGDSRVARRDDPARPRRPDSSYMAFREALFIAERHRKVSGSADGDAAVYGDGLADYVAAAEPDGGAANSSGSPVR